MRDQSSLAKALALRKSRRGYAFDQSGVGVVPYSEREKLRGGSKRKGDICLLEGNGGKLGRRGGSWRRKAGAVNRERKKSGGNRKVRRGE